MKTMDIPLSETETDFLSDETGDGHHLGLLACKFPMRLVDPPRSLVIFGRAEVGGRILRHTTSRLALVTEKCFAMAAFSSVSLSVHLHTCTTVRHMRPPLGDTRKQASYLKMLLRFYLALALKTCRMGAIPALPPETVSVRAVPSTMRSCGLFQELPAGRCCGEIKEIG